MLVAFQIQADHLKIRPNDATVQRPLFIKNSELYGTNGDIGRGVPGLLEGPRPGFGHVRGKIERYCQWGYAYASNNSRLECDCHFLEAFAAAVIHGQNFHMSAGL